VDVAENCRPEKLLFFGDESFDVLGNLYLRAGAFDARPEGKSGIADIINIDARECEWTVRAFDSVTVLA
jgi:hypothetical protein